MAKRDPHTVRHLIALAFFVAATVAYFVSLAVPGAAWFAGALFAAGAVCELVFWFLFYQSGER